MSSHRSDHKSAGAAGFLLAAALCVGVSLDTSWRMFGEVLGIVGWERLLMFSALEVAFVACGYSMRSSSRQFGTPGPSRLLVWALAALASYFAVVVAGPLGGSVRAAVVLCGVVFLHHALGIEIRSQGMQQTGTLARVGREMRERLLSRLGLADDERDALTRTRERAARRAARLALAPHVIARQTRVARALTASRVGTDERAFAHLIAEVSVLRHARALAELDVPAPWADLSAQPSEHVSAQVNGHVSGPPSAAAAQSEQSERAHAEPSAQTRASAPDQPGPASTSAQPFSDQTYADGVLDGSVLAADTPPPWSGMSKTEAVRRADALLPGRTTRQLAAALAEVGITVPESSIRRARTAQPAGRVDQGQSLSDR